MKTRLIKAWSGAAACLLWACLAQGQTNEGVHLLSKGGNVDIGYTHIGIRVNDMAFDIRNVPNHPDDGYAAGGEGPIKQAKYDMSHSAALSVMYGWEFGRAETAPLRLNIGVGADWIFLPAMVDETAGFAERNYTDAPGTSQRGYGAALTYVGLRQGGAIPPLGNQLSDILLNWTPRIKAEVAPFGGKFSGIWLGTSVSYFIIDAQNGWDRYDQLEIRKDYPMAHVIPVRLYMSWLKDVSDYKNGGITAGVQLQPAIMTAEGRQSNLAIPPVGWFVEFSARF